MTKGRLAVPVRAWALAAVLALRLVDARAQDAPPPVSAPPVSAPPVSAPPVFAPAPAASAPRPRKDRKREGDDLLDSVSWVATFDFGWSVALTASWMLSGRVWDAPQPQGLLSLFAVRTLYGTSWSVMLTSEVALMRKLADDWSFLSEAWWATDRLFGFDLPGGCRSFGSDGGCAIGTGGFTELRAHLTGLPLWLAIGGGWIQGRFSADERRTIMESTWVLSPLCMEVEVVPRLGPFALRLAAGPGIYFGMHNAHVHPRASYAGAIDVPWHEILPLDGGLGGGGRAEAWLAFPADVRIEADAVVAPFAGPSGAPKLAAPLDARRGDGPNVWRALSVGASVPIWPSALRLGLRYWSAELSPRPLPTMGHKAVMLRWDIPMRR